tara:strand:- start:451 stop:744 length:294 start_codon:yes stop_codon:yes gene_type:complete
MFATLALIVGVVCLVALLVVLFLFQTTPRSELLPSERGILLSHQRVITSGLSDIQKIQKEAKERVISFAPAVALAIESAILLSDDLVYQIALSPSNT